MSQLATMVRSNTLGGRQLRAYTQKKRCQVAWLYYCLSFASENLTPLHAIALRMGL